MERPQPRPPLLIRDGTLTNPRDIVRALETIDSFAYRYLVDGEEIATGRGTLVRIMYDDFSATTLVNGCLFLNVASFMYMNFSSDPDGRTHLSLFTEGAVFEIVPTDDPETRSNQRQVIRMLEEGVFDDSSFVSLDDDEDDD